MSSNITESSKDIPLVGTWESGKGGCPQRPKCQHPGAPEPPEWEEASFDVNRREPGSAPVGGVAAGSGVGGGCVPQLQDCGGGGERIRWKNCLVPGPA